jgi:hypothetical protein
MCLNTYLFTSQGWTNINLVWSVAILSISATLVILAFPVPVSGDEIFLEYVLFYCMPEVSSTTIFMIIVLGESVGWFFTTF